MIYTNPFNTGVITMEQPKSNFINYTAFNMVEPSQTEGGKASSLIFSQRKGWPRITVFYGDSVNRYNIYAPMDITTMLYLLDKLKSLIDEPNGSKYKIDCYNLFQDKDNPNVRTKKICSEVWFGKDDDGIIWISLKDKLKESPSIRFKFTISNFIAIYENGVEITDPSKRSAIAVKGRVDGLKQLYTLTAAVVTIPSGPPSGNIKPQNNNNDIDEIDITTI